MADRQEGPIWNINKKITRLLSRTRLILVWEQLVPKLALLVSVLALFFAFSWAGFWPQLPNLVHGILLALFAGALGFALWNFRSISWPEEQSAIDRVEAKSETLHRPLSAHLDEIAQSESADPASQHLWKAHLKRSAEALEGLKSGNPERQLEQRDPWGARALVVLLLFIGFNMASGERLVRLGDAFVFKSTKTAVTERLDVWLTPPRYTRKAPVFLTRGNVGAAEGEEQQLTIPPIPQGSILRISAVSADDIKAQLETASGSLALAPTDSDENRPEGFVRDVQSPQTFEAEIKTDTTISISFGDTEESWQVSIIPDTVPEISMPIAPSKNRTGSLEITAYMKDDYGVTDAEAIFERSSDEGQQDKSLYEAPTFPLSLNGRVVKEVTTQTTRSLVAHPWAGAEVLLSLQATDSAEQVGLSEKLAITLPARRFSEPLAKALVEQRLNLALDRGYRHDLVDIIDLLTLYPDEYKEDYGSFMALAAVRRKTIDARNDDDLRAVVDMLWEIATGIEDGDLTEAEKNLRAAMEALREAIENGVTGDELAQLVDELRQAMQEFMQAMAENSQQQQNAQQSPQNSQEMSQNDLQNLLDQIENLAQTGSREAAQQLLNDLQRMMENMQVANGQQQGEQSEGERMLNELGDMIREQQQLMDETFRQRQDGQQQQGQRQQQGQQQQGQQPGQQQGEQQGQQQGQNSQQGQSGTLQQRQSDIQGTLQELMRQMEEGGMQPGQEFGEADQRMGDAAGQLGEGDNRSAGGSQQQALDALREGAQQLAEQMAQQNGEGEGEGEGSEQLGDGRDPLGRQQRSRNPDFGSDTKVPDRFATQRAQEILDAIRRRLNDNMRRQSEEGSSGELELDYLERLIEPE